MSCKRARQAINIGTVKIATGQEAFLVTYATLGVAEYLTQEK